MNNYKNIIFGAIFVIIISLYIYFFTAAQDQNKTEEERTWFGWASGFMLVLVLLTVFMFVIYKTSLFNTKFLKLFYFGMFTLFLILFNSFAYESRRTDIEQKTKISNAWFSTMSFFIALFFGIIIVYFIMFDKSLQNIPGLIRNLNPQKDSILLQQIGESYNTVLSMPPSYF